jgi:hypothetical protein
MSTWLDTQTKALLQQVPPEKLAPADTGMFTLVLLAIETKNRYRVAQAIAEILKGSRDAVQRVLAQPLPRVVKSTLSHADALLGQFEFICCDCVSVFLADGIVEQAPRAYLVDLYAQLRQSREFEVIPARIESLPNSPEGDAFLYRFLGQTLRQFPTKLQIMRKKARIMEHWAEKIGGRVVVLTDP